MNQFKHSCIVDGEGVYKDIALVLLVETESGQLQEQVQYYTLQSGESLLDVPPPTKRLHAGTPGLVRHRWNGAEWVETATPAEIAAWEAEHPAPDPPPTGPTLEARVEVLTELVDAMLVSQLMSEGAILHD